MDTVPLNLKGYKKGILNLQDAFYSVRERIRTLDLLVRSQTLYPAELHAHMLCYVTRNIMYFI